MANSFISDINRVSESVLRGRAEEEIDSLEREVLRSALQAVIENLLPNAPEAAVHSRATRSWENARGALERILAIADECAELGDNPLSEEAQQFVGDWDATLRLVRAIRRGPIGDRLRGDPLQKMLAAPPFEAPVGNLLREAAAALGEWEKAEYARASAFSMARDEGEELAQELLGARLAEGEPD